MIRFPNADAFTHYSDVRKFAQRTNQLASLYKNLWVIHTFCEVSHPRFEGMQDKEPILYEGTKLSRAWVGKDFAPYSFNVALERLVVVEGEETYRPFMTLGVLYHGEHDKHGSGQAPTFAVTVQPTQGWSIHS